MRWLRLGMGAYGAIQAIQLHDTLTGLIAAFFLFQAITNTGCCGATGCSSTNIQEPVQEVEEIHFEEVTTSSTL
ncbi:MAG: hypothetical protein U0Y10_26525 [Spirosomataceae bacterium]